MTGVAERIVTNEDLVVARSDIEFFDTTSGGVSIQVKVRNSSDRPSPPRAMAIYSAPLGAFLPQRHLVTLTVPSLRPGAKTIVQTTAARSMLKRMSPSIFDSFACSSSNWVGNIHVLVNGRGAERHLARGLRVRAGMWNRAVFRVGNCGNDAYSFHLLGDGIAWSAFLFAMRPYAMVEEGCWIPASQAWSVDLQFYPPENSSRGKIDVEVTQRSTGRKAVVEFSLEAA